MPTLTPFDVGGRDMIPILRDQTLEIEPQVNGRVVAGCTLLDRFDRPNYLFDIVRPDKGDVFLAEFDDGTRYGGIVWDIVAREYIVPNIPTSGLRSVIRMTDYEALLDVTPFNEPVPAGTMKSQIQAIETHLAEQGITISTAQADGPTLAAGVYEWKTLRQVLDDISLRSTWIRQIDADGVLLFTAPGTVPAATPITEADGNFLAVSLEDSLNDYRNQLYLIYGPNGQVPKTEIFTGDGTTRRWTLTYQLAQTGTGVTPRGLVVVTRSGPSVSNETIDADPAAGTAQWHYDVASTWDNAIEHDAGETVLGVGETVTITYNAQFPGAVFERDVDEFLEVGPFTAILKRPDITDAVVADAVVAAELQRLAGDNARVRIVTREPGYAPGQTVTLDLPILGIQEDVLITEMRIREVMIDAEQFRTFVYELTGIQGNVYRENWRAFWRQFRGEDAGGGSPTMPPSGCAGALLWQDDFNSGTALSTDYTVTGTPAKTASVGPDASQAVVFPGTGGPHRLRRDVVFAGRASCVSMDMFLVAGGFLTLQILDGGASVIDCSTGPTGSTPLDGFSTTYFGLSSPEFDSDAGVAPASTWINLRIAWQVSTYVGPGVSDHALDGYVRIYIDEVLVWSAEDVMVGRGLAAQTEVDIIRVWGDDLTIDNFMIRDGV
jgi:hypothetical protein